MAIGQRRKASRAIRGADQREQSRLSGQTGDGGQTTAGESGWQLATSTAAFAHSRGGPRLVRVRLATESEVDVAHQWTVRRHGIAGVDSCFRGNTLGPVRVYGAVRGGRVDCAAFVLASARPKHEVAKKHPRRACNEGRRPRAAGPRHRLGRFSESPTACHERRPSIKVLRSVKCCRTLGADGQPVPHVCRSHARAHPVDGAQATARVDLGDSGRELRSRPRAAGTTAGGRQLLARSHSQSGVREDEAASQ